MLKWNKARWLNIASLATSFDQSDCFISMESSSYITQKFIKFWHQLQLCLLQPAWPEKSRQMSIKVAQKWFHSINENFWHLYKNCLKMLTIWAKYLLPQAFKSCPKCNKVSNLVTLVVIKYFDSE